jgi:hypothetical protein
MRRDPQQEVASSIYVWSNTTAVDPEVGQWAGAIGAQHSSCQTVSMVQQLTSITKSLGNTVCHTISARSEVVTLRITSRTSAVCGHVKMQETELLAMPTSS